MNVILPMGYWGISFWGQCLWPSDETKKLEHKIHLILFPAVQFLWEDYCRANGIDPQSNLSTGYWRNRKCDVQAIWSHIHHKRDVFVTSDGKFHKAGKKTALIALGAGRIKHPEGALSLFQSHKS